MSLQEIVTEFRALSDRFQAWAKTIDWTSVHANMKYFIDQLPKDIENESIRLMNRGWFLWFLDGSISDFSEKIKNLIGESDYEQDEFLKSYFLTNCDFLKNELENKYPNRLMQINEAFKAHEFGLYYCSIPTFLALSEGICRENYPNIGLFAKHPPKSPKAGLPKTDDLFDSVVGLEVFDQAILKPLRVASNVTKSINSPTIQDKQMLNRHLIMHGHSDQYGTEINSLKAISLAYFVHKSLEKLKQS